MTIGIMTIELFLEGSQSLKEKRRILLSIKDRLRQKFNISIIESDHQNLWQKIQLTAVTVANTRILAEKTLAKIEETIFSQYPVQILKADREYF